MPVHILQAQREAREESKNRNNSPAKNLELWAEMKKGSDVGLKCAVRAKINMQSDNGCMRDPTIYRCKPEPHPATKDKFKVSVQFSLSLSLHPKISFLSVLQTSAR